MSRRICCSVASTLGVVAIVLGASEARALRPYALELSLQKATAIGKANLLVDATRADTRVQLALANPQRDTDLLVVFPECSAQPVRTGVVVADLDAILRGERPVSDAVHVDPEPSWKACILEKSALAGVFVVPRGTGRRVKLAVDFRAAGPQQVRIVGDVYALPDGAVERLANPLRPSLTQLLELQKVAGLAGRHPISLFYEVEGAGRRGSFRRVLPDALARAHELPADENVGHEGAPYLDATTPIDLPSYSTQRRVLPETLRYDPRHADLAALATGSTDDRAGASPSASAAATTDLGNEPVARTAGVPAGTPFLLKGKWSVKWTDTLLHPAWGWNIVAWWNKNGTWIELRNTIVSSDGSYAMVVWHPEYSGQHLRMQVRAQNPFFKVVKESGSVHRYVSVDRYDIPQTFDDGHRWVDVAANGADGLGEVYEGGYQLWHEMYFRAGINPMRAERIRIFFPNTWEECGVGEVWSCASREGDLWIKYDHAESDTIQHELGHQMHYEFWDDKLPAAPSGAHDLTSCYDRGKALTEGYADFVPYWVQNDRASVPQGFIESPHGLFCKTPGKENEGWVAATFWDLHDDAHDVDDHIYFTGEGAVHAIFFNNPIAHDGDPFGMDDLRTAYRSQASPQHQAIVDAIFAQNGTN